MTEEQKGLVENNLNLVYHVLKKFPNVWQHYDEYVSAGMLGLCKAAIKFDASKCYQFSTYAARMIWGFVMTYYRDFECSIIRIPRSAFETKEFPAIIWLDGGTNDNEQGESYNLYEKIEVPEGNNSFEEELIAELTVDEAISNLNERELRIFDLRFNKEIAQTATAKAIGMSQAQVSRIESKIKTKIKGKLLV